MAKSPIFGGFYQSRSLNLADNVCINLYPEIVEDKSGKSVGALYGAPGLTLQVTAGTGSIRGAMVRNAPTGDVLYVVSGSQLYSIDSTWTVTALGTLPNAATGVPSAYVYNVTAYGGIITSGNTHSSTLIDGLGTVTGVAVGQSVQGSGIPMGAVVSTVDTATLSVTISPAATTSLQATQITFNAQPAGTLLPVDLPFTPTNPIPTTRAVMLNNGEGGQILIAFGLSTAFLDGFGFMNQPGTPTIWQSGSLDLSVWDPTAFGQATGDADNILALIQIHREIFAIKNGHIQVFINGDTPGFVLETLDEVYDQAGTCSPYTWVKVGESLMGIAQLQDGSVGGATVCVQLNPYQPQRMSDHSMERIWQTYSLSAIQNAFAYSYEQEGHLWYVVTFPGEQTWAYDVLESQAAGVPLWTQRAAWNPTSGLFSQHQGNCFAFFNGLPLVGDSSNGNIYALDLNALTDNGAQRRWVRSWRALPGSSDDPIQFHYLRIDMQTGIGVPDGTAPQCVLDWSDDGGHTWSNQMIRSVGPPGATAQRVLFQRLGATRRNHGLDRIFRLQSSDQFPVAIIGAEVR